MGHIRTVTDNALYQSRGAEKFTFIAKKWNLTPLELMKNWV